MQNHFYTLYILIIFCCVVVKSCKAIKSENSVSNIDERFSQYFGTKSFTKLWNTNKTFVVGIHKLKPEKEMAGLPVVSYFVVLKVDDDNWVYEKKLQNGAVSWHDDFTIKIYNYTGRIDQPEIDNNYMLFDVRDNRLFQPTDKKR